jgi:hypothetical protein
MTCDEQQGFQETNIVLDEVTELMALYFLHSWANFSLATLSSIAPSKIEFTSERPMPIDNSMKIRQHHCA